PKRKMLGAPGLKSTPATLRMLRELRARSTGKPHHPSGFACQRCADTAPADEHAARNILQTGLALDAQAA
ncbi:MAG: hypothetical protein ACRDTV_05775, partial [Mycobacterium sp.]